ncbi:phage portal protein [Collinsella aerofaciens]|uniref:phage portal protein n=1 Tax=Collinsella aerofaciens TaxID=74426 RepID=UPI00325B6D6D
MKAIDFLGLRVTQAEIEPAAGGSVESKLAAATYFKAIALATAISYKANALAMCLFRVYKNGKEVNDDLWYRLNVEPNDNQNAAQFWCELVEQLCMRGDALVVPVGDRFYVADSYSREEHPLEQDIFSGIVIGNANLIKKYRAGECMFFKLANKNISSYVESMLDSYSTLMAAAMAAYKATCGQKYKLVMERSMSGSLKDEGETEAMLKRNLTTFIDNANAVYFETKGARLEPVKAENAVEPTDISDLRKEIYDSAAIAFKVPKSVMYGDMTNMGDLVNTMLTFSVDPEAKMISDEVTRKNFPPDEIMTGSKVKVDTTTIKHIDIFDAAASASQLVSYGVFTINDVLKALGYEPVGDDLANKRLITKNLGAVEDVLRDANQGGEL